MPLSGLWRNLFHLPALRPRPTLLQPRLSPTFAATTKACCQSSASKNRTWSSSSPDPPTTVPITAIWASRDGSWFPEDHRAALSEPAEGWTVCFLRSLQPLDRPFCRKTPTEEGSQAPESCRQELKKIRFQMIGNTEAVAEVQFKLSVFADKFTPCEVSSRTSALFAKLEPEALGEKYRIENFGTVKQCILLTKHWNHHVG
jgi:hypothetical protein